MAMGPRREELRRLRVLFCIYILNKFNQLKFLLQVKLQALFMYMYMYNNML